MVFSCNIDGLDQRACFFLEDDHVNKSPVYPILLLINNLLMTSITCQHYVRETKLRIRIS